MAFATEHPVLAQSEYRPAADAVDGIVRSGGRFEVVSEYEPAGDQPAAIDDLERRVRAGERDIVLLGATGTGKSATTAWLIEKVQRPTLVMAPNKTLAAQLANEFRELLPNNAVEYFVSYYDYYQPEAYVPRSDTYIEKESQINEAIDRMRHSATRALLERGAGGPMRVPTYGGGTVRTEFEVLTGMPVSAFPSVMYPYVDMARPRMPGLPALLRDLGYATVAVHGNSGAFWNRTDTFRAMGIQRFLTEKAFRGQGVRDGVWYSDASMTDLVLQELEAADAPLFVAAISIENHGPYESEAPVRDAAAKEAVPVPDVLPARAAGSLRNYLYHLGNADRELERLLRRMEQRGRPFVVVFFGDHLPALPEVYNTLQFADGGQAEEQMVPWLVVGDGGRRAGARPLHSWELAAEALEVAGLAGDPYFDLVRVAGRRLAALPPDSPEADELRRGVEAAAVARMQGRFEEFLR